MLSMIGREKGKKPHRFVGSLNPLERVQANSQTKRVSSRLSLFLLVNMMVSLVAASSGCSWILDVISDPLPSIYMYVSDGDYYVGDRCSQELIEIAVFMSGDVMYLPFDMDRAVWHGVADAPGVVEFQLFSNEQPGVVVVFDDDTHPESVEIVVSTRNTKGYERAIDVNLSKLEEGMVFGYVTPQTLEEFWRLPNSDFGC